MYIKDGSNLAEPSRRMTSSEGKIRIAVLITLEISSSSLGVCPAGLMFQPTDTVRARGPADVDGWSEDALFGIENQGANIFD